MPCSFKKRADDLADTAVADDDRMLSPAGAGRAVSSAATTAALDLSREAKRRAVNESSGVSAIVTAVTASVKLARCGTTVSSPPCRC